MPVTRPDIPYSGVPTVEAQGGGGDVSNVRATPESFGAGVAGAVGQAGQTGFEAVQHYQQMATDAKVNDDYANKYAPAAAQLRSQYDTLRGSDKIAGYDGYIAGLQDLNKQFTSNGSFVYQKQIGSLIDRHISGEIDGAKRELVTSQIQYEDQSHYDAIKANRDLTLQNSSSPDALDQVNNFTDNLTLKKHMDDGYVSDSPAIDEAQKQQRASNVGAFIDKNISSGDLNTANQIRAEHSDVLPADQRQQIDGTLHVANIQQTSQNAVAALKAGQPIPHTIGAPATQVQATVADGAQTAGIDPNHALTVLRIESANGQNLGKNPDRMSIGQDKESSGKPLDVQAATLCKNLKTAGEQADSALGRKSDPWEGYVVYQQGAGGGPALLKADPNAKAVDVLRPLYKDNASALEAVTKNGGNAAMTAEDFLGTIRDTYNSNAAKAKCNLPDENPGSAIIAPHTKDGIAVQPGASPVQDLINFNKRSDGYLSDIMAIPNADVRNGVLAQYNKEKMLYSDRATSYTSNLVNQAGQLAADSKFTSMDQVPPAMLAALTADHPQTITMLEARADYNAKKGSGIAPAENNIGSYQAFNDIATGKVTTIGQLQERVWKPGDDPKDPSKISIPTYDKLAGELTNKAKNPDVEANLKLQNLVFENIHNQISPKYNREFDPSGELKWQDAYISLSNALDKNREDKIPDRESLDQHNKNYIGLAVKPIVQSDSQNAGENIGNIIKPKIENTAVDKLLANPYAEQQLISDLEGKYKADAKSGLAAISDAVNKRQISIKKANGYAVKYGYANGE